MQKIKINKKLREQWPAIQNEYVSVLTPTFDSERCLQRYKIYIYRENIYIYIYMTKTHASWFEAATCFSVMFIFYSSDSSTEAPIMQQIVSRARHVFWNATNVLPIDYAVEQP